MYSWGVGAPEQKKKADALRPYDDIALKRPIELLFEKNF
jgi:hypothetical protein